MSLDNQAPDVVMILLGLNDWGNGMSIFSASEEVRLDLFSVAYRVMLEKIKTNYPKAEIWCLTLPRGYRKESNCLSPVFLAGKLISEYCDAIRDCAKRADCKIVDIFCPDEPYDTIDGYHPTAEGMQTIANAVIRRVVTELNY